MRRMSCSHHCIQYTSMKISSCAVGSKRWGSLSSDYNVEVSIREVWRWLTTIMTQVHERLKNSSPVCSTVKFKLVIHFHHRSISSSKIWFTVQWWYEEWKENPKVSTGIWMDCAVFWNSPMESTSAPKVIKLVIDCQGVGHCCKLIPRISQWHD